MRGEGQISGPVATGSGSALRDCRVGDSREQNPTGPQFSQRIEAGVDAAGEGYEVLVAAAIALHAHEAVLEAPAAQVFLELAQYEAGQRAFVTLLFIPQVRQVSLDDRVKRGVLRPMALVAAA
jgi:hypothetical protein